MGKTMDQMLEDFNKKLDKINKMSLEELRSWRTRKLEEIKNDPDDWTHGLMRAGAFENFHKKNLHPTIPHKRPVFISRTDREQVQNRLRNIIFDSEVYSKTETEPYMRIDSEVCSETETEPYMIFDSEVCSETETKPYRIFDSEVYSEIETKPYRRIDKEGYGRIWKD